MTTRQVLLATGNQGKVREMSALLSPLGIELLGLAEMAEVLGRSVIEVEETGETFLENALLKARGYSAWAGLPAIAEDSGLCVDQLGGAPGVFSARFAGEPGDDGANNRKLLASLSGVPDARRGAHYHTSVVYIDAPTAEPVVAEGQWHGRILTEPVGEGGFGYDPLFWVDAHGCSSAQLPATVKNELSHRGHAVRGLVESLKQRWK